MGSPYLSSNESIILSTNNVVVNAVPAEAILTNERLMLVDTRHAEHPPQDIPFHAIETVTIGENSDQDPMLSLSLVTGPGVTQAMGIVFPQQPRMRRVAERDEWANRLKELSIISVRESGTKATEVLPPWVPGQLIDDGKGRDDSGVKPDTQSPFRNPPLAPRKIREPAPSTNRTAIAAVVLVIVVIALAAGVYFFAPSLIGMGGTPLPPVTPTSAAAQTTVPTPVPTTVATTAPVTVPATVAPTAAPGIIVPQKGVYVLVKYEGSYTGSAGAPERMLDISSTGNTVRQLPARNEVVFATVQKLDNSGKKLIVEIYSDGTLVQSGSVIAPKGTVNINADLKTP